MIVGGLTDEAEKSDYAVVFGNTVNADGSLSARLQARVDKGLELYKTNKVSKLFVSGGLGKEGFKEGDKMAEYLMQHGVPAQNIIVDNQGDNTRKTIENFKAELGNDVSVVVVSQYFHLSRAKLAFRKNGYDHISGESPSFFELRDLYSSFREFFAYYKYWWLY